MEAGTHVFIELLSFIKGHLGKTWWARGELTRASRLYEDLRIDGDDAIDFFIAFEKKFGVDLSNFKLGMYFNGEGFDPIGISKIVRILFGQKELSSSRNNVSITLGHLEKAIKAGRLDDEIISG